MSRHVALSAIPRNSPLLPTFPSEGRNVGSQATLENEKRRATRGMGRPLWQGDEPAHSDVRSKKGSGGLSRKSARRPSPRDPHRTVAEYHGRASRAPLD